MKEDTRGMKGKLKPLIALTLLSIFTHAHAIPYYGATFSTPVAPKEPQSMRGFQVMLVYDPQKYKWKNFDLYFDGGYSYFSASSTPNYTALNIYSIAPILRYTFEHRGTAQPFMELSVGAAYLNHTRLECRNLGIHFAFQDRLGIGVLLGNKKEKVLLGFHVLHYSNAHLSEHNSGLTSLVTLDIGYRFS